MGWKKKEKALTKEQALQQAKDEFLTTWHNSQALYGIFPVEGGKLEIFPLTEKVTEQIWMFIFLDPSHPSFTSALQFMKKWSSRYSVVLNGIVIVFEAHYEFQAKEDAFLPFLTKIGYKGPAILDSKRLFKTAFEAKFPLHVAIIKGTLLAISDGTPGGDAQWFEKIEAKFQQFFWEIEPGIPFRPPLKTIEELPLITQDLDFGSDFKSDISEIELKGQWTKEAQFISTNDPEASITLPIKGSSFFVIVGSTTTETRDADIYVDINRAGTPDLFGGPDLKFTDQGAAFIRAGRPILFHLLSHMTHKEKLVTLRFPSGKTHTTQLYGIRFAN